MWDCGWGMGTGGFGWITMLLFWALLVLGIVYLWRTLSPGRTLHAGSSASEAPGDRALEILRERYAKVEIGKEEFEERKRDLM